ncbi:hypothetical protein TNCV_3672141 [Trichonephila clavipes]|nr:hypothetical protein TNCV_3672141 [Trichonephila clavipes]
MWQELNYRIDECHVVRGWHLVSRAPRYASFVNPTPLAHADTPRDIFPRGGYHKLVAGKSTVRALVPLKPHHIEGLMQGKSVTTQSPPFGMLW